MLDIPQIHIEQGYQDAHAGSEYKLDEKDREEVKGVHPQLYTIELHEDYEYQISNDTVIEAWKDGTEDQRYARKINPRDQIKIIGQGPYAAADGGGKKDPGRQGGKIKYYIGNPFRGKVSHPSEYEIENNEGGKGVQDDPGETQICLFIFYLGEADGEKEDQVSPMNNFLKDSKHNLTGSP